MSIQDNICFLIFPTGGFYGNNYDIICCSFLLFFPQSFKNFCISICYIHLQIFFTGFFKDNFYSIQYSSAPEGVLQYKC
jgi:hypothetical protein